MFEAHIAGIEFEELARLHSHSRLVGYLGSTDGDRRLAVRLYEWNLRASGAFYELLADVELVLRNCIHEQMSRWSERDGLDPDWFVSRIDYLDHRARADLEIAVKRIEKSGNPLNTDRLVTELGFGFWRFLLTNRYRGTLWTHAIRFAFPNLRADHSPQLFTKVGNLHDLRNRIAHHRPIHHRRLELDLRDAYEVIGAMSQEAEKWARGRSRVEEVMKSRPRKS